MVIGDAAHAMPPTTGQGASVALEDAESLAYLISLRQKKHHQTQQGNYLPLLKKWEQHRMQRIARLFNETEIYTNSLKVSTTDSPRESPANSSRESSTLFT